MENLQGNLGIVEKHLMPTVTSYNSFMGLFIVFLTTILIVSMKISYLAKLNTLLMFYFMIISIDFSGIMREVSLSKHCRLTHGFLLQNNALKPNQSEKRIL